MNPNQTWSSNFTSIDFDLKIESIIISTLGLTSIFVIGLFIHLVRSSTGQTGSDVRSLLLNSLIARLIRATYLFFRGVYVLCLLEYGFEQLAINRFLCSLIELPYGIAAASTLFCMLAIGINRFHVTRPIDNDAKGPVQRHGVSKLAKLTIFLIWSGASAYYLFLMIGMNLDTNLIYFCYYPLIFKSLFSYVVNGFFFTVELFILITYAVVFVRNRNMLMRFSLRTRQYSLRQRFRAWANVRTTRMLLPSTFVHVFLLLIVVCCMSPVVDPAGAHEDVSRLKLILVTQIFIGMDTIAYPLLCIWFNEHFRFAAKKMLTKLFCRQEKSIFERREDVAVEAESVQMVESDRPRSPFSRSPSSSQGHQLSISSGKRAIIDYRLAPETHEHILYHTWEMKG